MVVNGNGCCWLRIFVDSLIVDMMEWWKVKASYIKWQVVGTADMELWTLELTGGCWSCLHQMIDGACSCSKVIKAENIVLIMHQSFQLQFQRTCILCTLSMHFQSTSCAAILHYSCLCSGLHALSYLSSLTEAEPEMLLHACINNNAPTNLCTLEFCNKLALWRHWGACHINRKVEI